MSARQIKKMKQHLGLGAGDLPEIPSDSEEDTGFVQQQPRKSAFAAMQWSDSDSDSDSDESSSEDDSHLWQTKKAEPIVKEEQSDDDDDNLDAILAEIGAEKNAGKTLKNENETTLDLAMFLEVNQTQLNFENEMKSIFGENRDVVDSEEEDNTELERMRRIQQRGGRKARRRKMPMNNNKRRNWRNLVFSDANNEEFANLPVPSKAAGGMFMNEVSTKKGNENMIFNFEFPKEYRSLENTFENLRMTDDINSITIFHQNNPHHVGSLLLLSDMYLHTGQNDGAFQLLKRAMYLLESASHPHFKPWNGRCRLPYEIPENQSYYKTLFKLMQLSCKRGAVKTAAAMAKVIYSLDPENDPLGMLCCIDYFALKARDTALIMSACDSDISPPAILMMVRLLPNWALSRSVALKISASSPMEHDDANQSLINAFLRFPQIVPLLLKKIGIEERYGHFLGCEPFCSDIGRGGAPGSELADHLCALSVERLHKIFETQECKKWVATCVELAIDRVKVGGRGVGLWADLIQIPQSETYGEDCFLVKYEDLKLEDFTDEVARVPAELLMAGGEDGMRERLQNQMNQLQMDGEGNPQGGERLLQRVGQALNAGNNPLRVFLESMLPWTSARFEGQAPEANNEPILRGDGDEPPAMNHVMVDEERPGANNMGAIDPDMLMAMEAAGMSPEEIEEATAAAQLHQ
eukprot:TRINITY_DN2205_c0_g1_i1.p1 TRINITY_DN2205_c0_g1~~TRINITY_DN2205_c0_g1_i1.p1  ORF type:complete len:693 (-),score=260.74 TRINITY_DN2205_c0_g1_i1:807-2885(-)